MDKDWIELRPSLKRTYAKSVWIPLRSAVVRKEGAFGDTSYREDYEGTHSIIIPISQRELGEEYSWNENSDHRPWADKDFYKTADTYSHNAELDIGWRLVMRQGINYSSVWHISPDLIIALNLIQEGDVWLRPEEGYAEVMRMRSNVDGEPEIIEIKAEFLRDYLCARQCALRISSYRQRDAIVGTLEEFDFEEGSKIEEIEGGRYERRAFAIDETGSPFGSKVAVFRASRTDDVDEDVPVLGPENNDNMDSESWSFTRDGTKLWRVSTEFWRDEWVEPASASPRVRGDHIPSQVSFIIEADGSRANADDLNDEDIGRWLWFAPTLVPAVLAIRGSNLTWYTKDTGGFSISSGRRAHFGLNETGLITVYAADVARLPEWQRRVWAGFNVTPEGKVSSELLSAQVRAKVAETQAPEQVFEKYLNRFNQSWEDRFGSGIIRPHENRDDILGRIHRFRSLDRSGLFALAKDVTRLTADSFDIGAAQKVALPPRGQKWGSLKSVEAALATICGEPLARYTMGPLVGAYNLRLADAHLPPSDLAEAFALVGIDENDPFIVSGYKLLDSIVIAVVRMTMILQDNFPSTTNS